MSYERSGKVVVPQWWLDKALPIIDREPHTWLAQQASQQAGRQNPWGPDAISEATVLSRRLAISPRNPKASA